MRGIRQVCFALLMLIQAGCGASGPARAWQPADGKIRVVATTMQVADFIQNIAGDTVEIQVIMKEGSNHHTFEPTVNDMKLIGNAHILVISGVGIDSWFKDLQENSGSSVPVIDSSVGIDLLDLYHPDHIHEDGDPHIWLNTENAKGMVDNITAGLVAYAPEYKGRYEANATTYKQQIDQITDEIRTILAPIPTERRKLVTSHEAFQYFAKQFDLQVVGTVTIASDSTEPSPQQVLELIEKIKEKQAPAVFTETSIDPRLAEQIASEAKVKVVTNLYSDSLSAPGGEADTYLKMMLHNARTIAHGLMETR